MPITIDQFREYVASVNGRELPTIGGRTTFTITPAKSGFAINLKSGKRRNVSASNVRRVLEIYNKTGSLTTSEYRDVTVNISYLLSIIVALPQTAANAGPVARSYFTHYWTYRENVAFEGEQLTRVASNQFRERGVDVGDIVYCVSFMEGDMCLVGRMEVGKIVDGEAGARESSQSSSFDDRGDHCIAERGTGTEIRFDRIVPIETAKRLRFNGNPLKLDPDDSDRLDTQTLRGIRQLDAESAEILEAILSAEGAALPRIVGIGDIDADGSISEEGNRVPVYHLRLERDPRIVRQKKREVFDATGKLACESCDFDFAAFYGELGDRYAECHHRVWLSKTPPGTYRLTKTSDLAIVCSNCHRMLHRDEGLNVETLRRLVNSRRSL